MAAALVFDLKDGILMNLVPGVLITARPGKVASPLKGDCVLLRE